MIKGSSQKKALPALIVLYFALTASIHFLHTETTVNGGSDCSACRFNSSNSSPVPYAAFELPPPSFLDWALVRADLARGVTPDIRLSPRAPPAG